MLKRLRNTLIVAMSIFMLLGIKEVSYAKDGFVDVSALETTNEFSTTNSTITSIYNKRLDSLLSKTNMDLLEKYSNLLVICYCQISNLYINDEITEEWYLLQREPFIERINKLPTATNEEILDSYKDLLVYLYDTMTEDELSGYEIDQDLHDFVMDEINLYNIEL